ncbi:hypothetical protein N7499_009801 [Penicillium canescens]|nr:hypothetical protein N7499_009801 [Penicillium canescens]KAJ6170461.1 hypothetical protein N7485_007807 [Penicillium canescens]
MARLPPGNTAFRLVMEATEPIDMIASSPSVLIGKPRNRACMSEGISLKRQSVDREVQQSRRGPYGGPYTSVYQGLYQNACDMQWSTDGA